MADYRFQIDLRGMIDLLSNHLYSGPHVYVRELLQNAVDAIRARTHVEPAHAGEVRIEVTRPRAGAPPTLVIEDDGIGLTEDEIHQFLATIGQSSKRDELAERRNDFIGQFGIGILSCFLVSDEIVLLTRSIRGARKTYEWRGRPDGTYTVKELEPGLAAGTRVYLRCKAGCESFFAPAKVRELAREFGGLLPVPIHVSDGESTRRINEEGAPWRRTWPTRQEEADAILGYGRRVFEIDFLDWIPLRSAAGDLEGVAFVLPTAASLAVKNTHRIYLKNMLLSQKADNLLPEWAFFVKCVANANDLRPTASRESFYEDEALQSARAALGGCLREYLVRLAAHDPIRLRKLIAIHFLSIKTLAAEDEEFYRLFIDWLPFETSLGMMTLGEYRKQNAVVRFVPSVDQFRQIAGVAAAQSLCVLNGGYVFDGQLLRKLPAVDPDARLEEVSPSSLMHRFEDLTVEEQARALPFLQTADVALRPFACTAELKKYLPAELPALYSADATASFRRSVELSRDVADTHWASILENLAQDGLAAAAAELCLNYKNPLVQRISALADKEVQRLAVRMLYVQALLLGHHPLRAKEMALLGEGLLGLIERAVGPR